MFSKRAPPREQQFVPLHSAYKILVPETSSQESLCDECLICGAPLEYLETEVQMECAICHKKENSKTRCVRGHYVCNDCHTAGLDAIVGLCLHENSKNPVEILESLHRFRLDAAKR